MARGFSLQARWAIAVGACALGAGLYALRARRATSDIVPSTSAPAALPLSSASARPSAHPSTPPKSPFEDPATPRVVPFQSQEALDEQRIRSLPPERRRAERSRRATEGAARRASRYPAECRPASEAIRRVLPHYVVPQVRPLAQAPMEAGHALVRAAQDLDHLIPGASALLTLEVAADGGRVPFEVKGAELLQPSAAPGARPESLASVEFRDDGISPDKTQNDGVATAKVSVPERLRTFDGELRVRAVVSAGSETGEVFYPLFVSSAAAASFTGTVREAVENGSLAFYAGIRVKKTGRYAFTGRVYDSEHRAMAVLTASAALDPSVREVRLTLCGALLRDEGIAGPWELRDVEGLYIVQGSDRVDRIPVATWNGPHRTREYPLETFSDAASTEKTEPSPR